MVIFFIGGLLLAGLLLLLLDWWAKAEVTAAKKSLIWGIVGVCLLLGALLLAAGRGIVAVAPMGFAAWRILGVGKQMSSLFNMSGLNKTRGGFSQGAGNTKPPAEMSRDEAFSVLGLTPSATEEDIKKAHKSLIAQCHPDKGGSDWLAAQINDARRVLLE